MSTLAPGQSVGRYKIVQFLGAGAMGEVYLADDPQIDRRLAIKTVRLVGRESEIEDRKKRLLREARAAGRMLHPNIVTLFDAGEADGLLFLAFEYVEGADLGARVDAPSRLTLREVLRIGRYTAEALEFAHRQGIVHRDIKPGNILLDTQGKVKVTDFGIAKVAGQATELTMAGSVLGSPQYLSPEQIRGEDLDGRSDLFSLGVVLYEILSRKRPFEGDTLTSLVYSILTKEPPPISELRAVPQRLEALLARMLAKDRDERIGTAGEVARELSAIELDLAEETLMAPAGAEATDKTTVLPRRPSSVEAPLRSASPSTKMTVPPAPGFATSDLPPAAAYAPPPPPPSGGPIPPPPVATPSGALAVAPPPVVPAGSSYAARPGLSNTAKAFIAVGSLLALVAVGVGGGWMVAKKLGWIDGGETPSATKEPLPAPQGGPAQAETSSSPPVVQPPAIGNVNPSPPPAGGKTATPTNPVAPGPRTAPPSSAQPERRPEVSPAPSTQTPIVQGGTRPVPPVAAPDLPPVRTAPAPPIQEEPEEERPKPRQSTADRSMASGLQATFNVEPSDSIVVVDRTVIGRASEWAGGKHGQVYTFPGADSYRIRFKKDGMREATIDVEVKEAGGITPINVRLRPLAGVTAESQDLATYRTSDAFALKVQAAGATFSVDGQSKGMAKRYSGGIGHSGWLSLPPGKHRVSIVAPGFQQQDVMVEVSGSTDEDRVMIPVTLSPGG